MFFQSALFGMCLNEGEYPAKHIRLEVIIVASNESCTQFTILKTDFFKTQVLTDPSEPYGIDQLKYG